MNRKRIILDTNLWISFLISRDFQELDNLILREKVILLFSNESLEEFIEVIKRPKFIKVFSKKDVEKLLNIFDQYAELVLIESKIKLCRDPKDNFLLNMAVDGKADFLVTGDKDLLIIEKIKKTQILTFKNLLKKINASN